MTDGQVIAGLPAQVDAKAKLDEIAKRYHNAGGLGIKVLNAVGARADSLLGRLPQNVQSKLQDATIAALHYALDAAQTSRGVVPDQADWVNTSVSAAMGAVGGFGGLPSALAELPVTTTLLLRVIQGVAAEHGFDPDSDNIRYDCVEVFSAAGPLAHDDSVDLAFLSARVTLSGAALQALIARVAPRFATALGQKLAAQTVPVLGAVAGAATNTAYTKYYTEMAHVHFGLRKLAIDADMSHEEVQTQLRIALDRLK